MADPWQPRTSHGTTCFPFSAPRACAPGSTPAPSLFDQPPSIRTCTCDNDIDIYILNIGYRISDEDRARYETRVTTRVKKNIEKKNLSDETDPSRPFQDCIYPLWVQKFRKIERFVRQNGTAVLKNFFFDNPNKRRNIIIFFVFFLSAIMIVFTHCYTVQQVGHWIFYRDCIFPSIFSRSVCGVAAGIEVYTTSESTKCTFSTLACVRVPMDLKIVATDIPGI